MYHRGTVLGPLIGDPKPAAVAASSPQGPLASHTLAERAMYPGSRRERPRLNLTEALSHRMYPGMFRFTFDSGETWMLRRVCRRIVEEGMCFMGVEIWRLAVTQAWTP